MKSGFKSLIWLLLIVSSGLLQVWVLFGYEQIYTAFQVDVQGLILDGVFLFFSTAIVTSMTADYYFDKDLELPKWQSGVLFSLFPLVIVGLTLLLYWFTYTTDRNNIDLNFVLTANQVIISMSLLYCFISKVLMFGYEPKESK